MVKNQPKNKLISIEKSNFGLGEGEVTREKLRVTSLLKCTLFVVFLVLWDVSETTMKNLCSKNTNLNFSIVVRLIKLKCWRNI
jgi:hypothetical protein